MIVMIMSGDAALDSTINPGIRQEKVQAVAGAHPGQHDGADHHVGSVEARAHC